MVEQSNFIANTVLPDRRMRSVLHKLPFIGYMPPSVKPEKEQASSEQSFIYVEQGTHVPNVLGAHRRKTAATADGRQERSQFVACKRFKLRRQRSNEMQSAD